ncbi:MAG TPA: DUF3833 family protein [Allosphingosinicella sp.]|nr:DUF3833 family protein [Allosphingosinicella sp.]
MRILLTLLPILLSGCVGAPRLGPPDPGAPRFDPIAFFAGPTEGEGTIRKIFAGARSVRVRGTGHVEPDGMLVLDQLLEEAGAAPRRRQWRMRETAPGRYSGSLSDAERSVVGESSGNRLRLRFRMSGGLDVEQWLTLGADGRTVSNRMIVRKFGITVAAVTEIIRRTE